MIVRFDELPEMDRDVANFTVAQAIRKFECDHVVLKCAALCQCLVKVPTPVNPASITLAAPVYLPPDAGIMSRCFAEGYQREYDDVACRVANSQATKDSL